MLLNHRHRNDDRKAICLLTSFADLPPSLQTKIESISSILVTLSFVCLFVCLFVFVSSARGSFLSSLAILLVHRVSLPLLLTFLGEFTSLLVFFQQTKRGNFVDESQWPLWRMKNSSRRSMTILTSSPLRHEIGLYIAALKSRSDNKISVIQFLGRFRVATILLHPFIPSVIQSFITWLLWPFRVWNFCPVTRVKSCTNLYKTDEQSWKSSRIFWFSPIF